MIVLLKRPGQPPEYRVAKDRPRPLEYTSLIEVMEVQSARLAKLEAVGVDEFQVRICGYRTDSAEGAINMEHEEGAFRGPLAFTGMDDEYENCDITPAQVAMLCDHFGWKVPTNLPTREEVEQAKFPMPGPIVYEPEDGSSHRHRHAAR